MDNPHQQVIKNEEALAARQESKKRERFVLVVGAGASNAATNGYMPLGKDGAEEIRKRLIKRIPKELIEEEIKRLKYSYRLEPEDFETKLLAFSRFSRKDVVTALREICGYAHIPSLAYEILAHMLKHRFLDIIINFNYDEVLDVAVKEELQDGAFRFIYSDAHCPSNYQELLINNRLRQPVYLKPHGTISHRSSLRFTREDYFSIPPEIRKAIKDLINGQVFHWPQQQFLPLNIIVIGYNLMSFEFVELLQEYLQERDGKVKLWVFDIDPDFEEFGQEFTEAQNERIEITFFNLKNHGLDAHLMALWNQIQDNFKDEYRPRGIERHLLVNQTFNLSSDQIYEMARGKEKDRVRKEYFLARFYVELVISLLQSDGLLNDKQILEDRAGKYFHHYLQQGGSDKSLKSHCSGLGLKVYKGFGYNAFLLEDPNLFYEKEKLYAFLFERLRESLPPRYRGNLVSDEYKKQFSDLARSIRSRNIAKITPNFTFPHNHKFSHIEEDDILNTTLGWVYRFQKAMRETDKWNLMLSVSEKGRFLNNCIRNNLLDGKKAELVLSSFDMPDFRDLRESEMLNKLDLLSGKPLFLPWWLHNKHLVLLLKRTGATSEKWEENWKLAQGFYYESHLLSRRVNPVHIRRSPEDLKLLLYVFANYWYRARAYTKQILEPVKSIPIIAGKSKMEEIIQELLRLHS